MPVLSKERKKVRMLRDRTDLLLQVETVSEAGGEEEESSLEIWFSGTWSCKEQQAERLACFEEVEMWGMYVLVRE